MVNACQPYPKTVLVLSVVGKHLLKLLLFRHLRNVLASESHKVSLRKLPFRYVRGIPFLFSK